LIVQRLNHLFSFLNKAREVLTFVSRDHKKTLLKFALVQALTGILDLIGIALIGVIGSIALRGVTLSRELNPMTLQVLRIFGLETYGLTFQVSILAVVAGICLIARSISAFIISSRIFHFLGREGAELSTILLKKILKKDLVGIEAIARQESLFIVTNGSNKAALDVAGSLILVFADVVSLSLLVTALIIVDAATAMISILLFGILGYLLFNYLKNKAASLGATNAKLFVETNNSFITTLDNIRFLKTADLIESRIKEFAQLREQQLKALAELSVMPYISKYVFEIALVSGALIISAIQFVMHDAIHAITTLTIFLAAGGRLAPSALRVQQSSLMIRANLAYIYPVLALYKEKEAQSFKAVPEEIARNFEGTVELSEVDFSYPNAERKTLDCVNLRIPNRSFVAIVGPSGSGKSTLMDVLLGLNKPQKGTITISSKNPVIAFGLWPGKVSYVPQTTVLMDGTIGENITFGREAVSEDKLWKAIELANLEDLVTTSKFGIHANVGELGSRLSAGQRQRIGIARALYSEPELMVMDEPTSALDAITEQVLANSLKQLRDKMTLVVVAHRLSTITTADKVIYLSDGKILAEGTMSEVRSQIPEFDTQSQLLGIKD
jgi:ABC-type multidrug transport system fused ATPase/permease subunit